MIRIDLHFHSNFSDGTLSPEALVAMAKKRGLSVLSLTDHDTTEGVPPFLDACRRMKVRGITGVELSADFPGVMHILGYRYDPANEELQKRLSNVRYHRNSRNARICEKLQELGIDITLDEVEAEAGGGVVARPHIARVLIRKGYVQDIHSAFDRYLCQGAPAYVPRIRLSPEECISLIRSAGGLPVLAHPCQTTRDDDKLKNILAELKGYGLWGMECISGHHTSEQIFRYLRIAAEFDLWPTAGSDYHGSIRPGIGLGVSVSEDFLPWSRLGISL